VAATCALLLDGFSSVLPDTLVYCSDACGSEAVEFSIRGSSAAR
jgi:hypothetical protein